MKRTMMILLAILMLLSVCMTASAESGKRVAKDGAQMQTDDPTMPTRLPPENGTKILLHFGDTVIPGVLNDSETAQALIAKLPYTQHMSRYSHDFCGVTEDLPYNEEEEHYGWLNGDIDYATDAPYFTILFEDQDESEIDLRQPGEHWCDHLPAGGHRGSEWQLRRADRAGRKRKGGSIHDADEDQRHSGHGSLGKQ